MNQMNQAHEKVRAAKVILYMDSGKKYIYKLGDPDPKENRQVTVEMEVDSDYDEVFLGSYVPAAIYKTSQKTSIKLTA